jgi:hypothetical protein
MIQEAASQNRQLLVEVGRLQEAAGESEISALTFVQPEYSINRALMEAQ